MTKRLTVVLLLLCLSCVVLGGVHKKNTFSGYVLDEHKQPVASASIVLNNQIQTISDEKGFFLLDVKPGEYRVSVICLGYEKLDSKIQVGSNTQKDFTLISKNISLDAVEVKGKSKTQQLRESAYSVNALNIGSIAGQLNNLNTVVGKSSGIKIREKGGVGSDFDLSINGLSGNAVKYFVDGVPLSSKGSGINLANFPVNLVDRVEIYKGFVPPELGTDALGGAINIITKNQIKNYVDISYGFGSFNTHKADFYAQYFDQKTGLYIRPVFGVNYSENNYKMKGVEVWDQEQEKFLLKNLNRFHDDYLSLIGELEVGVSNKKWADVLSFSVGYSHIDKELQTGSVQSVVYGMATRKNHALSLSVNYKKKDFIVDNLSADISFSHTWDHALVVDTAYRKYRWDGAYTESSRNEITGRARSKRHTKRPQIVGRANFNYALSDKHAFNLNYSLNKVNNDRYDDVDKEFEPSNDLLSKHIIGLSYTQNFFDHRWMNTYFVKDYINHFKFEQNDLYWITGAKDLPNSSTKSFLGYGLGSRFRLRESLAIKASYEHTYRLPSTREFLGNGTTIYSNLRLKPENSNNFNVGLFGTFNLDDHQLYYEAGFFTREVKDYIRLVLSEAEGMSQYENVSNVTIKGIEGEIRYSYKNLFQIIANCSYMDEKNKTKKQANGKPSIIYNNRMPNRPWLYSNVEADLKIHDLLDKKADLLKFSYSYQYVHWYYLTWEGYGLLKTKSTIPTQHIHTASLSYSWYNEKYNLSLECANIFDHKVYDNYMLQKPGRSFFAKLRFFFN